MSDELTDEKNHPEHGPSHARKIGIFFTLFALVIFVCGFGYGYFELLHVNAGLAQTVTGLQADMTKVQTDFSTMQKSMDDLQLAAQKTAEVTHHQEQLIAEWQAAQNGDLNKWHLAEAQYFVKLANDHVQFTNNIALAIQLLQRADQELVNIPSAADIHQAISQDIAALQALPQVDVAALYAQLNETDKQIDQLPLPQTPLKAENESLSPAENPALSWWRTGLNRTWESLQKIVIVRNIGSGALPLVMPDEKLFLYQNLHAELASAIWGLLHQDNVVYQASLVRMQEWIKEYFVQDAEITKSLLQKISELGKTDVKPHGADLGDTLKLFDTVDQPAPQPEPANAAQ